MPSVKAFPLSVVWWAEQQQSLNRAASAYRLGELAAGEQKFFTPEVPGFHEIRVGRDVRVVAVNPPSNEGNLDMIPPGELIDSVQSTAAEAAEGGTIYVRRSTGPGQTAAFLVVHIIDCYIGGYRRDLYSK